MKVTQPNIPTTMARTKTTTKLPTKSLKGLKKPRTAILPVKTKKETTEKAVVPASGGVRKPHRYRPGTVALREIRRYQKGVNLLTRRLPFQRMVKRLLVKICDDNTDIGIADKRFQANAIELMREASEVHIIRLLERSNLACIHGKRMTVMGKDIDFINHIDIMSS